MASLTRDLRYAIRTLWKSRAFTAVAIGSLALGIGANTAIFTLTDQLILRLLPVKQPEQLVLLSSQGSHYGNNTGSNAMSYPMYCDIRDRNQVFSGMFARYQTSLSLGVDGSTERVSAEMVSGNYFAVLGVDAALGRVFTTQDDLYQEANPIAVISYSFWQNHFGGDRNILGRKIELNQFPYVIVGVSQKGFEGIDPSVSPQIRVPLTMKKQLTPSTYYQLWDRRSRFANVFGRLKPNVTITQAKASLQPLFHNILEMEVRQQAFAKASAFTREQFVKGWVDVLPASKGRSNLRTQFQNPLWVLLGITGVVLLIACANLANLLIARAAARQKEVAMRLAVGASRWQLIRQLLVECLLLSLSAASLGLFLAFVMDRALISMIPQDTTPIAISPVPDLRVFGFAIAVSFLTALLFGLAPALMATAPDLTTTLKDQAASVTGHSGLARKCLVVAQISLSLILLVASGLFVQTLRNLKDTDPGFHVDNLVSFKVDPPRNGYTIPQTVRFYRNLQDQMQTMPGVKSAGLAVVPLLEGDEWDSTITVEGYRSNNGEDMNPHMNYLAPRTFEALSIPLLLGRDFNARDDESAPKVAIVNQSFANRYFKDGNPIGRRIGMGGDPGTPIDITIIGMVRDTKYEDMRSKVPFELYRPYTQIPFANAMTAYVRTESTPERTFNALRNIVKGLDANLPVYAMRTMREQVNRSVSIESLVASLSTIFGVLATLLAAIGLYGVMAYTITRRTREIGIRMALGADPVGVMWLVMREILALTGTGVLIGILGSIVLTRYVRSQLYGVAAFDAWSLALAIAVIALTAAISGWKPVRRATGIQPMLALRWE